MDGWALRLTAAAVLTLSGAAFGRSLSGARRLGHAQLVSLNEALSRLEVWMLQKHMPLAEALRATGHDVFDAVAQGMSTGQAPGAAFDTSEKTLRLRGGGMSCVDGEDIKRMRAFFMALGASGASEQRLLIESTRAELLLHIGKAREQAQEQAKLYMSLGLLSGLALSIFLM